MEKLGHFMKNLPALIAQGWVNLSEKFDNESDVCILASGCQRKVFLYTLDQEVATFVTTTNVFDSKLPKTYTKVNRKLLKQESECV
ncbi:MAG: hypothetical protein WCO07_03570 [bacterium]